MLNKEVAYDCFAYVLANGGDFCEIFMEDTAKNSIQLINGKIENVTSGIDYGLGLRIFAGERSIYVYTNHTDRENLLQLAKEGVKAIQEKGKGDTILPWMDGSVENKHRIKILPSTVHKKEKVNLLKEAHFQAMEYNPLITETKIIYADTKQNVLIANSLGKWALDERIRTRVFVEAIASSATEKQSGYFAPGAQMGYEFFDLVSPKDLAEKAAETAVTMLKADFCKGGAMPVVIGNGFGGVLFHEACGHSLEATSVAKGQSVFSGRMGTKIASELVTAYDDGTISNGWGSINIDDEGNPSQKNLLIEKGILKSYLIDTLNGRKMKMKTTGSGRRESYKYPPTSRMTNTYIDKGESTVEEIIQNTDYGLYAKNMGGGSVDPATGTFNFSVLEGYMIRNGKIAEPVRGAALIGKGEEILNKIDMVGNDLLRSQGMCGSVSGSIPVDVGQPTLRVSSITVGGRN